MTRPVANILEKFAQKAAEQGIELVKNEKGEIVKMIDSKTGEIAAEFEKGVPKKGLTKFLETDAGREFITKMDSIGNGALASEWRGVSAQKNFLTKMLTKLV